MRGKSILCMIAALFMLFSGMCLENVQADSSFAYAMTNNSISYRTSQEAVISNPNVYTTEMIGVRNASCIQQFANRSIHNRRTMKISFEFLRVAEDSQIFSNFYTTADMIRLPELHSKTAVLNYIHNQDGKKRI